MKIIFLLCGFIFALPAYSANSAIRQAESLLRNGKSDEAKRVIAEFITQNEGKKSAQTYMAVGSLFARLKRWPDAIHYYQIATSRNENSAEIWYKLGIAQHQAKQVNDSVISLRKSVGISSKTEKSTMALGEVLQLAQARMDARNVFTTALKKLGPLPSLYSKLCLLNFQDAFYTAALKFCRKAVQKNPHDVVSMAILGKTLYDKGKRPEAFQVFGAALKRRPEAAIVHRVRGLIYYQEKSYEQAMLDLGKAFGLDASDEESSIFLARALFELGHYEHAMYIYIYACQLNRDYRFEFISKQRELGRMRKDELAEKYLKAADQF